MHVTLHKNIECTDGKCGRIASVIINPVTQQITHLVVDNKSLTCRERLVPISWVASSTYDLVNLRCSRKELAQCECFNKKQFMPAAATSYPSPPHLMQPYVMPQSLLVPQASRGIPPEALEIRRGARVEASDGSAGKVEEFLVDPVSSKITHLLLSTGLFYDKRQAAVPVSRIDRIAGGTVYLKAGKKELAALPLMPVTRWYIWNDAPVSDTAMAAGKQKNQRELSVIRTLIRHLTSRSGLIRHHARTSLVAIGNATVPSLLELRDHRRREVRWEAVKALGEIGNFEANAGLISSLTDESFDVRWLAAEALIAQGQKVIVPLLRAIMLQPGSELLRESAHHILRSLVDRKLARDIQPVLKALEDIDFTPKVRVVARKALRNLE